MSYTSIEANDFRHVVPRWYRLLIRWTSPAWYLFILFLLAAFIYCIIVLAFTKDKA